MLLERNKEHFKQAEDTPFTTAEMIEAPFMADSRIAEDILKGKHVAGPTLEATWILKECRRVTKVDEEEIFLFYFEYT